MKRRWLVFEFQDSILSICIYFVLFFSSSYFLFPLNIGLHMANIAFETVLYHDLLASFPLLPRLISCCFLVQICGWKSNQSGMFIFSCWPPPSLLASQKIIFELPCSFLFYNYLLFCMGILDHIVKNMSACGCPCVGTVDMTITLSKDFSCHYD